MAGPVYEAESCLCQPVCRHRYARRPFELLCELVKGDRSGDFETYSNVNRGVVSSGGISMQQILKLRCGDEPGDSRDCDIEDAADLRRARTCSKQSSNFMMLVSKGSDSWTGRAAVLFMRAGRIRDFLLGQFPHIFYGHVIPVRRRRVENSVLSGRNAGVPEGRLVSHPSAY